MFTELVAQVIARDGWDKDDMVDYLYKNAKQTARYLETRLREGGELGYYCNLVKNEVELVDVTTGNFKLPQMFCESEDPDRLVPVFMNPKHIHIVLGGDEARNRITVFLNNGQQGSLTSMKVELPQNWDALYAASQLKKDMDNMSPRQFPCL